LFLPVKSISMVGRRFNLKSAVEREKAVQAIDVSGECTNCVVTFWVMSQFLYFLGALRDCTDFCDPTAVFRLNGWLDHGIQASSDQPSRDDGVQQCIF